MLAALRGRVIDVDNTPQVTAGQYAQANFKQAREKQAAQIFLREAMALWAGWMRYMGMSDDIQIMKRFYLTFDVDVITAQTLGKAEADALGIRIRTMLQQHGVTQA